MICPFCNIDKEKTVIINEDLYTRTVLSNPRLMPGHVLIIPKRHIEKISELKEEERKELFDKLIIFQEKILSKISKGCDIKQNYRPFQKQNNLKVNHLHFHLQPREFEDELYHECQKFETNIFCELSQEEKQRIYDILKQ